MYADKNKNPVEDNQPYTSSDGIRYPANYPKDQIAELTKVALTAKPTDGTKIVTGFTINSSFIQVWNTRDKTTQELADDIAAAKATANLKANELAETERLKYITPGYGQSNSYQEKYSQAVAFKADGNPDAQTYPYIYLEATETGSTPSDIADLIIATRNQFVALDAVIESKRRGYLVSIAAATTIAQVNTIKQAISYAQ